MNKKLAAAGDSDDKENSSLQKVFELFVHIPIFYSNLCEFFKIAFSPLSPQKKKKTSKNKKLASAGDSSDEEENNTFEEKVFELFVHIPIFYSNLCEFFKIAFTPLSPKKDSAGDSDDEEENNSFYEKVFEFFFVFIYCTVIGVNFSSSCLS